MHGNSKEALRRKVREATERVNQRVVRHLKEKDVPCSRCQAAIGQNCLFTAGTFGRYHPERIALARGIDHVDASSLPSTEKVPWNPPKKV